MADKMKVHDSLAGLELDSKPEPYRLGTPGGPVTFPDPADMPFDEGEDFLNDLALSTSVSDVLERWLSEEDWGKLKAARPTLGQLKVLSSRLQAHYSYIFGGPGEDTASATS